MIPSKSLSKIQCERGKKMLTLKLKINFTTGALHIFPLEAVEFICDNHEQTFLFFSLRAIYFLEFF